MQITGKKVLIFGGWGEVGSALCNKIMSEKPAQFIISSLRKEEAEGAIALLKQRFPKADPNMFVPEWGNIFTRNEFKDINTRLILADPKMRRRYIDDIFNELDDEMLESSMLYTLVKKYQPDLVLDAVNTATTIAYQDVYTTTSTVLREMDGGNKDSEQIEKMIASMYIPQISRHIQILQRALNDNHVTMFLKIGTSGTGGMGLNIPYTHSEARPSRVLLAKTAVAGAQTLLLFLMARTPGCIVKEIKPTAAIGWKRIAYDKVKQHGQLIPLVDMKLEDAHEVNGKFTFSDTKGVKGSDKFFESVFIDTGENGVFAKSEFETITSIGQMELINPEDIANAAIFEIKGGNTGNDVIQGLDAFTMGPTYRAGVMRAEAMKKLAKLEEETDSASIAFELMGPPRLSKLLFEGYMMRKIYGNANKVLAATPEQLSKDMFDYVMKNNKLRSQMLSIGLVIMLPDGKKYLRGKEVKIPTMAGYDVIDATPEMIDKWCNDAWIDLRPVNFVQWHERLQAIKEEYMANEPGDTSSKYNYSQDYWDDFNSINEGRIIGWVLEHEDKGYRFKR